MIIERVKMYRTLLILTIGSGLLAACSEKPAPESNTMKEMSQMEMQGDNHDHNTMDGMDHSGMDHEGMHEQGEMMDIAYYTCPMPKHKHVRSETPGNCPECGMELIPVVEATPQDADFWGCPMPEHTHVRAEEAGQCPECGMNLKPYKFEKS